MQPPARSEFFAPPKHVSTDILDSHFHREMCAIAFPERTGGSRQWRARRLDRFHLMKMRFAATQRHFPSRLANYIGYVMQRQKRARVTYLPPAIQMEACLNCVLGCPGCHIGLRNSEGKHYPHRGTASLTAAKAVIDEVFKKSFQISLHLHGEPLLSREFFDICAHANGRGLWTVIHSNLNPEVSDLAPRLITCGLNNLVVSIDGATQEIYEKYRRNGNLERVVRRIEALAKLKKERGVRYPWISAKFLVFEHNWHEIKLFRDTMLASGADEVVFVAGFANGIYDTGRANTELEFNLDTLQWEERDLPTVCPYLWKEAAFDWDGGLFPCGIGNTDEHKVSRRDDPGSPDALRTFNSPGHRQARQFFLNGPPWPAADLPNLCSKCEIVRRNRERSTTPKSS